VFFNTLPLQQTAATFLHHFQCHEVHQRLHRPGIHANQSIVAGLFIESQSLHTKMTNKKRSKKKGHVLVEKSDVGVGPCGGGTSTAPAT